jgi:hypothetical protein
MRADEQMVEVIKVVLYEFLSLLLKIENS